MNYMADLSLYWKISGDEIDSDDFNENSYEGKILVRDNQTNEIELFPKADNKEEGNEQVDFILYSDEKENELESISFI